jgi:hypothetical protein
MTVEFFSTTKLFKMAAMGHVVVQPHVGFDGKQSRHGWLENTRYWVGEEG